MKTGNQFSKIKSSILMVLPLIYLTFFQLFETKAQAFRIFVSMEMAYDDPMAPGKFQWVARMYAYKTNQNSGGTNQVSFEDFTMNFSYHTGKLSNPRYYVIIHGAPVIPSGNTSYTLSQGRYTINPGQAILSHPDMPTGHEGREVKIESTGTGDYAGANFSSCIYCGEIFRIYFDIDSSSTNIPPLYYPNKVDANPVYWNPGVSGFLADVLSNNVKIESPGTDPQNPANPVWFLWPFDALLTNWKAGPGAQGISSFNYGGISAPVLIPLPVELIYFEVNQAGDHVLLKWMTTSESGNRHFEIERSQDGINWLSLGQNTGAGNSEEMNVYEFTDRYPVSGISYYRLKQVDYNGAIKYSELKEIIIKKALKEQLVVYPNPATNYIYVVKPEDSGFINAEIRSTDGKSLGCAIYQEVNENIIPISHLAPGLYYIYVQMNDRWIIKSFIKE